MIDEKELSGALQALADRDEAGPPPVAELLHRGRRARTGRVARTAAVTAVSLAVVGAVAVVARPAPSAPVPLALAAQTTERTTFRFHLETRLVLRGEEVDGFRFAPWDGKYDPVHDRGYRMLAGNFWEERQIGPRCYVRSRPDPRWRRAAQCWRVTVTAGAGELPDPASPGDLLAQFRKAGQVSYEGRTGAGADAVDTYRFSYPITRRIGEKNYVLDKTGTVDIDVANRRITRVVYLLDNNPEKTPGLPPQFMKVVMRFDDFGTPVVVEEPET